MCRIRNYKWSLNTGVYVERKYFDFERMKVLILTYIYSETYIHKLFKPYNEIEFNIYSLHMF